MNEKEIIEIMSETKSIIYDRQEKSSPFFYDEIWNEEVEAMRETYQDIDKLTGEDFRRLWKIA